MFLSPTYKLRFAFLNQSKIGSKKWINELIYGKYKDASDGYTNIEDDDDDNDDVDDVVVDDEFEKGSNSSASSSSSVGKEDDDGGFERINRLGHSKSQKSGQKRRQASETSNIQNECFIIAINPSQKYFVLFDVNSSPNSLGRPLSLSEETYSSEMENAIMQSFSYFLSILSIALLMSLKKINQLIYFVQLKIKTLFKSYLFKKNSQFKDTTF